MMKRQPRKVPRFQGKFYTWSVKDSSSTSQELLERRLLVFSSGKRAKVIKYLWLKFLWDSLSKDELRLLYNLPEFYKDYKFISTLRLRNEGVPLRILRRNVNRIEGQLEEKVSSRESYLGYLGFRLEIQEIEREIRPAIKFSGYVRSIAAIGKGSSKRPSIPEPISNIGVYSSVEEFDWYTMISVGDTYLKVGESS